MRGTWQTTGSGGSGGLVLAIIAAVILVGSGAASVIASALVTILIIICCAVAASGVLAVAAAVWLTRRNARQAAEVGAMLAERRETLALDARPRQVIPPSAPVLPPQPQAIEHHHHGPEFHIYGADGQDAAARLIRKALTEENGP